MKTLFTILLLAVTRPPIPPIPAWVDPNMLNFDVLETVEVGLTDSRTVPVNIRIAGTIDYRFRVYVPANVPVNLSVHSPGLVISTVQEIEQVDPNSGAKLIVYKLSFTSEVGVVYLDITVLASVQPTIFTELGAIVWLDPNYDYTLAGTEPREHQKAVKQTQRYWYLTGQSILHNVRF